MAAYASSDSATGTGSVVITKPSGLAAGDLMVAFIADAAYGNVPNTPSGWTKIIEHTGDLDMTITAFAKIASAGDAAAADFTFTHPNGSATLGGVLYRITGTLASTDNIYREASNTGTEPSADVFRFATGFTPDTASTLLIMGVTGYSNTNGFDSSNATAYALETSNPSWTERHDFVYGVDYRLSTATATRTETTATGYYQITYTAAGSETPANASGILLGITDTANGTPTITVVEAVASIQAPAATGGSQVSPSVVTATATINDPTASSASPRIVNLDKPSAGTISNTDKP